MIWFLGFFLLLLAAFCYLLFAPFFLEIDSNTGTLGVRFHWLAGAYLVMKDSSLFINIRLLWWQQEIDILAGRNAAVKRKQPIKKNSRSKVSFKMVKEVIRTFRVNKCRVNIDTGDVQTNGILYPVFYLAGRYTGKQITINFEDKIELVLELENNLARILKTIIFHYFIIKKQTRWTT